MKAFSKKIEEQKKQLEAQLLAKFESKLFQYAPACPWFIKLQKDCERQTFSTKRVNKAEAAAVAKEIYEHLKEHCMDATLKKYGEKREPGAVTTIGDLIKKVEEAWLGQPRTLNDYCTSLRRVTSEIKKVTRDKADAVKIADLSHGEIELWRSAYIKGPGSNHAKKAAAQTSANSILRGCKALFGKKLMKRLGLTTELKNPFSEIELPNNRDHRFQKGGVDAAKLLEQAVSELADTDHEVFKTIVLALTLGLRRNEIDKAEFSMFNLEAGTISVDNSEYLHIKSERSRGVVELEPALIPIIHGWQAKATGTFVLESEVKPKPDSKYQHYRAQETFARATAWLRSKGVKSNEPLHYCRKLYGSLICDKHGVYAASRALRHADIQTTTRHYTSRTENVLPGLGAALAGSANVISIKPEISEAKVAATRIESV